jgi:Domain of unknown function (DUF4116)
MSDLRSRLNKIMELHGQALVEAVGKREPTSGEAQLQLKESCRSNRDLILRFAGSDPTDGKSRTQWLVKTYIKDEQFKLEDLGRVDAALAAFERFKRKLPVEQRELSRLKSLRELEALVAPFVRAEAKARLERDLSSATGREKRRLEEWKARDESIIIQEGKGLPTIAVPMTEFASKWWGRGTQWCTAAENDNRFQEYNKDAPLIVILCPDGAKFQLNVKSDTFQFMDNTDENVSHGITEERWNEFQALLYWALEQNGMALEYVPMDKRSLELCRIAIEQNGEALEHLPEEYRTPELCRIAIEQNGLALYSVPTNHRTSEVCRMAIQRNGRALAYVPENERTTELCRLAVEQDGKALEFVPEEHKTPDLCRIAVEQNGWSLNLIPRDKRTPELCRIAVEQNGYALQFVPSSITKDYRTLDLCHLAVEQDGMALRFVPINYLTLELCRLAVVQNGKALEYVPEDQRTPELCRLAIEQNGIALQYVTENHKTLELCLLAVEQDGRALQFVPEELRTPELCRIAVEQNGWALNVVPKKYQTLELCRIAISDNYFEITDIPEEMRTPELLALILPTQQKWHPDILQGLGQHTLSQNDEVVQQL